MPRSLLSGPPLSGASSEGLYGRLNGALQAGKLNMCKVGVVLTAATLCLVLSPVGASHGSPLGNYVSPCNKIAADIQVTQSQGEG